MKKILFLTFYFEPDLSACSFRNTPLAKELARQLEGKATVDVITTLPNRYSSFEAKAAESEVHGNLSIKRISIPRHQSGMIDQTYAYRRYFSKTRSLVNGNKYDLIFASSSRFFTAYLGYRIAKKMKVPLYLDIRDIFTDTMEDVLRNKLIKISALPILRILEKKVFTFATHINLISGGFREYFDKYRGPDYTTFSHGIDNIFLEVSPSAPSARNPRVIIYAGNFGEGQGLDKIVPQAAKKLGDEYKFLLIGDGGTKRKLVEEVEREQISNVEILSPVRRDELIEFYKNSDFLFIHLNNYRAFRKVLPSKIFELAAFDKPIIAGVAGYAWLFIEENISNRILFPPADVNSLVSQLKKYVYKNERRKEFIEKFKRSTINRKLAESIIEYL